MNYDSYFSNEKEAENSFISFLTFRHINNFFSYFDKTENKPIEEYGISYFEKAKCFFDSKSTSKYVLHDDIYQIYSFSKDHILNVLEKPYVSIKRFNEYVPYEKIRVIEPKTIKWLADKPGDSLKHKIALTKKINCPTKHFSKDFISNQLCKNVFNKIYQFMYLRKNWLLKKHIHTFSSNESNNLSYLFDEYDKLDELKDLVDDIFDDVKDKEIEKPNNTILDNSSYRALWNTYLDLYNKEYDYENNQTSLIKTFYLTFISNFFIHYDFFESSHKFSDINKFIFYSNNEDFSNIINFDIENNNNSLDLKITQNIYNFDKNTSESVIYTIKLKFINENQIETSVSNGLPFTILINNTPIDDTYFYNITDIIRCINDIYLKLEFNTTLHIHQKVNIEYPVLFSLNSYDNGIYTNSENLQNQFINLYTEDENSKFLTYNAKRLSNSCVFLNKTKTLKNILQLIKFHSDDTKSSYKIYDVSDNEIELKSIDLRRSFLSTYNDSYPVWRSILAAESTNIRQNYLVYDLCGNLSTTNELCQTRLTVKNNKFVHNFPEKKHFKSIITEHKFLENYLSNILSKQILNISTNKEEVINLLIESGLISDQLTTKNTIYFILKNETHFWRLKFDQEAFNSEMKLFLEQVYEIDHINTSNDSKLIIIPNFVQIKNAKQFKNLFFLHNKELTKGASNIQKYLKNKEICWYNNLEKLSLEVIKNGTYHHLVLVDKLKQVENTIGLSNSNKIKVKETFTLTKNTDKFKLDLVIGENNNDFGNLFYAEISHHSFPLKEDVEVNLDLQYHYGSEKTYLLKFVPKNPQTAPFDSIEVNWRKVDIDFNPKFPELHDYDENLICKDSNEIKRRLYNFEVGKEEKHKVIFKLNRSFSANNQLRNESIDLFKRDIHSLIENKLKSLSSKENKAILPWINLGILFDVLPNEIVDKKEINLNNMFYGLYLHYYDDFNLLEKYISKASEYIEKINRLSNDHLQKLSTIFDNFNDITIGNYKRFLYIYKANYNLIKDLIQKIIYPICMKLQKFDIKQNLLNNNNTKKTKFIRDFTFICKDIIELLICLLFIREEDFVLMWLHNKFLLEIISALKTINNNFYSQIDKLQKIIDEELDRENRSNNKSNKAKKFTIKEKIKSKYKIKYPNKDENLTGIWDEMYCLILYLSCDEETSKIIVEGESDAKH